MRFRVRRLLVPVLLAATVLVAFLVIRRNLRAEFGPLVALCPGPDHYGYTCRSGEGYAYLDATTDTFLYQDDGVTPLELPFPFRFYGTSYTAIYASSNGNLQFANANPRFGNDCLEAGPVVDMGDMIAPYWDDLDLRFFGFLEFDTFGTTPDRIFVVEWDNIPRFGEDTDDRVTFEVQFHEASHDLVFLYEDVTTLVGYNGSNATIGLQSEVQGLALQYGCFQPVVADASRILFPHPAEPNQNLGLETFVDRAAASPMVITAKGQVAYLVETLRQMGTAALPRLRGEWLNQSPPRVTEWRWLDLTGDGTAELVLLWRGSRRNPELAQLVVLALAADGQVSLLLNERLSTRAQSLSQVAFAATDDFTRDGIDDLLLVGQPGGWLGLIRADANALDLVTVRGRCTGGVAVKAGAEDGILEIVRDDCESSARERLVWLDGELVDIEIAGSDSR